MRVARRQRRRGARGGLCSVDERASLLTLPESRALAVDIAIRLRDAIMSGHFGPGEQLREEPIARSMGVSRGPVREALVRLEREGLVVIRRNRGAFVAQLAAEDLDEVYTLRVAIETLATQRACRFATAAHLAELQDVVDRMAAYAERGITEQEAADLDLRFHDLIYAASNHRRLVQTWETLRPQIHILLLNRNVAHEDFREYLVKGHQWILDALVRREPGDAVATIEDHLRGSYERVASRHASAAVAPLPDRSRILSTGAVDGD